MNNQDSKSALIQSDENNKENCQQSFHPQLPSYVPNCNRNKMSMTDFSKLVTGDEGVLLDFLADLGIIAKSQTCSNCGEHMQRFFDKSKDQYFWICTKSKHGVKCKGGKFSIRKGTFLQNVHLSIQQVLWFIWHFVHQLTVNQCRDYMSIGRYNQETVVEVFKSCRAICNQWIRDNFEPIGGFGTVVEFDESFFSGAPKYGRGGRGHAPGWKDDDPWVFGIVQRGSLDCWLEQVHNHQRTTLVPILNSRVKEGSVLCSDKWAAYKDLEEHLTVPDSYLGAFMCTRYAKQSDLDMFIFFLECAAEINRPFISEYTAVVLEPAKMVLKVTSSLKRNTNDTFVDDIMSRHKVSKHAKGNRPDTIQSKTCEEAVPVPNHVVDLTLESSGDDVQIVEI